MIHITPLALTTLSDFLKEKKVTPSVRVHQTPPSCGGDGQLVLSVDTAYDSDFTSKAGDLTLIISRALMKITGDVTIDFKNNGMDSGFVVGTQNIMPIVARDCDGCSGCFN
jgi:Fe-S cluster assembly iron-binding protein IscA